MTNLTASDDPRARNGAASFLRWWPVIVVLIGWFVMGLGGYFDLKGEITQGRTERLGQIEMLRLGQTELEKAQLRATEEQNRRLSAIESDIKELLRRGR